MTFAIIRGARRLGVLLTLMGTGATAAAAQPSLQAIDAELQRAVLAGETVDATTLARWQRELAQFPSAVSATKRASVAALVDAMRADRIVRVDGARSTASLAGTRLRIAAGDPGATCETALPIAAGTSRALRLPAGGVAWLRVAGADGTRAVTTRGSQTDASASGWTDCRETDAAPFAAVDDTFGLQADLPLLPSPTERRVRIRNDGDAGDIVVRVIDAVTISGRVVRDGTQEPVLNSTVAAFAGNSIADASYQGQGYTGSDGRYVLTTYFQQQGGVRYFMRTSTYAEGGARLLDEAWPSAGCASPSYFEIRTCTYGTATGLVIAEGGSRTGIDFSLGRGASVRGRVRDERTGAGIPGATASVRLTVENGWIESSAVADAGGRYDISGLPDVAVRVAASAGGYRSEAHADLPCDWSCPLDLGTPVSVSSAAPTLVDFALSPHATVTVTLNAPALPDGWWSTYVELLNGNGAPISAGAENLGDGRFRFPSVPVGTYHVRARVNGATFASLLGDIVCASDCLAELPLATRVTIAAPGDHPSVAITLRALPALAGTVRARDGTPVAGASVSLIGASGWTVAVAQPTNASGAFDVRGISPGTYFVLVSSSRHVDVLYPDVPCESANPLLSCEGAGTITFAATDTTREVDFVLDASAEISGRMTVDGRAGIGDISLLAADSNALAGNGELSVDWDGSYALRDIGAGSFRIVASISSGYAQVYPQSECANSQPTSCAVNQGQAVALAPGERRDGIDFDLRTTGARRGTVRDQSTGLPVAGVMLDLWTTSGVPVASTISDARGRFVLAHPSSQTPQSLHLSTDNVLGYRDEVYDNRACASGSVYLGTCSLAGAAVISLPLAAPAADIEIALYRDAVFVSGFE